MWRVINNTFSRDTSMTPLTSLLVALSTFAVSAAAFGQDLGARGSPQKRAICITNAVVHPVSKPTISRGFVLFDAGIIKEVGAGDPVINGNIEVIDAKGHHVYPGLIAAATQLGMEEISTDRGSNDSSETGDMKPEVYASSAINPDSTLIPVQRSNGILSFIAFPTGGTIRGHASAIRADGWTSLDMTLAQDVGLIINWPLVRPITADFMDKGAEEQRKEIRQKLDAIDGFFSQAQAYAARRASDPKLPRDVRFDGMLSVMPGESDSPGKTQKPVLISAQDVDQITSAVTWAAERKLQAVIIGGRDAPLCSELLKTNNVSVVVLGTHVFPRRDDSPYDSAFTLPLQLEQAGITWCLANSDETAHQRTLPDQAATAVAYGLDGERAVAAITLSVAQIFGLSDRIGSLEAGKAATLFICSSDVLEVSSNPTHAWIDGKLVDLSNKQTKLYDKYRGKYEGK